MWRRRTQPTYVHTWTAVVVSPDCELLVLARDVYRSHMTEPPFAGAAAASALIFDYCVALFRARAGPARRGAGVVAPLCAMTGVVRGRAVMTGMLSSVASTEIAAMLSAIPFLACIRVRARGRCDARPSFGACAQDEAKLRVFAEEFAYEVAEAGRVCNFALM